MCQLYLTSHQQYFSHIVTCLLQRSNPTISTWKPEHKSLVYRFCGLWMVNPSKSCFPRWRDSSHHLSKWFWCGRSGDPDNSNSCPAVTRRKGKDCPPTMQHLVGDTPALGVSQVAGQVFHPWHHSQTGNNAAVFRHGICQHIYTLNTAKLGRLLVKGPQGRSPFRRNQLKWRVCKDMHDFLGMLYEC